MEDKGRNKTYMCRIRLSKEELAMFKDKAKAYQSISAMVRNAVNDFDDKRKKNKAQALTEMVGLYKKYQQQLAWLGGNFNQTVKRANELAIGNGLKPEFFEKTLFSQVGEIAKMLKNIKSEQTKIVRKLTDV